MDKRSPFMERALTLVFVFRKKIKDNKTRTVGILLIILGVALGVISRVTSGSGFQDFTAGVMTGLSVGILLVGIIATLISFIKKRGGNQEVK